MSKRLKDGVYKTTVGGSPMRYFVHDGQVSMGLLKLPKTLC